MPVFVRFCLEAQSNFRTVAVVSVHLGNEILYCSTEIYTVPYHGQLRELLAKYELVLHRLRVLVPITKQTQTRYEVVNVSFACSL